MLFLLFLLPLALRSSYSLMLSIVIASFSSQSHLLPVLLLGQNPSSFLLLPNLGPYALCYSSLLIPPSLSASCWPIPAAPLLQAGSIKTHEWWFLYRTPGARGLIQRSAMNLISLNSTQLDSLYSLYNLYRVHTVQFIQCV